MVVSTVFKTPSTWAELIYQRGYRRWFSKGVNVHFVKGASNVTGLDIG